MTKPVQCERCDSLAAEWNTAHSAYLCAICSAGSDAERVVERVEVSDENIDSVADAVMRQVNAADLMGLIRKLREAKAELSEIEDVDFVEIATKAKDGAREAATAEARFREACAKIERVMEEVEIPKRVEFKKGKKVTKIEGYQHKQLPLLADLVANQIDAYLGGPAGGGKNTACEQVAKAAGLDFHTLQLSKLSLRSDLVGYIRPMDGERVETAFSLAYANGGLFAADELDNWNSGVLTSINSALANGFYTFPWGRVDRHPEFVFVGLGNTIGLGATANYTERTALSGASRDRLVFLDWQVDGKLEAKLTDEDEWLAFVQECRRLNEKSGGGLLITPRATIQGTTLLKLGWKRQQLVDSVLLRSAPVPSFLHDTVAEFVKGGAA